MYFVFTEKESVDFEYLTGRALRDPDVLRLLQTIDELIPLIGPQWRRRAQRRGVYSQTKVCLAALAEAQNYESFQEFEDRYRGPYEESPTLVSRTEDLLFFAWIRLRRLRARIASYFRPQDRSEKQLLAA